MRFLRSSQFNSNPDSMFLVRCRAEVGPFVPVNFQEAVFFVALVSVPGIFREVGRARF